ncbi:MAG: carboxyl-terminal processing protease [Acidobacteriota bacterium]|nr:carboxyl-terminal processing protease [Acidobacteriota bacterium]
MLKPRTLRLVVLTILCAQLVAWQHPVSAQVATSGASPVVGKTDAGEAAVRRSQTFEIVWQTVKDYHFDPNFGGVNWDAVKAEFAPRVAQTHTDRELHWLLQQMLNRLGKSHFAIVPPESIPALPDDESDTDDAEGAGDAAQKKKPAKDNLDITERLTHGIGIDLRVIGGAVVITRVDVGSTAARAGLRTGFVIKSVGGVPVGRILREMDQEVVFQPAVRHQIPAEILYERFNGEPDTSVSVSYLDARNVLRRVVVKRERLRGEMSAPLQSFPPQFVEFESRRLPSGVGYIRFNVFAPSVMDKFCAALRGMSDAPGVVIDLRGNRGGILGMLQGLGGLLESHDAIFGEMRTRAGGAIFRVAPARHPYAGALAVLIDEESQSASEMFASGLQESGRAVLVGERSAGATLPSVAKELPTGAILQYAFADFVSPYGKVLEGQGVKPDVAVKLDRRSLLAGHDPQLDAAAALIAPGAGSTVRAPTYATIELPDDAETVVAGQGARNDLAGGVEPQVASVIERYVEAVGGRAALEKITSRVSTGTFEGTSMGVATGGTVEIIEKAPDKNVILLGVPGVGVMRRGFTGVYGYEQYALVGFREIKGAELDAMRLSSDFRWSLDLKEHYPKMVLLGRERVGDADANVVEATPPRGFPSKFYFDAQTGLLLRQDSIYFEDYRAVDGIRIPFRIRSPLITIKLKDVKHNVAIDDATFAEHKDCFTQ